MYALNAQGVLISVKLCYDAANLSSKLSIMYDAQKPTQKTISYTSAQSLLHVSDSDWTNMNYEPDIPFSVSF